jgi:hypothetical protein
LCKEVEQFKQVKKKTKKHTEPWIYLGQSEFLIEKFDCEVAKELWF